MAPSMTHKAMQELLGAYALDAVDADEARAVEAHLAECPRCRAEVAEHREAASMLSFSGASAPDDVWARISGELEEPPPPLLMPQRPAMRSATMRFAAAAAAIAAGIIAVLGVQVAHQNRRIDSLAAAANRSGVDSAAAAAAVSPEARRVHLESNDGAHVVEAVVLPDGRGYIVRARLPELASDRTYQLWGVMGAQTVSLGVLGRAPTITAFTAAGPLSALAITNERAGGVVASTKAPIVQGFVSA